MGSKDSKGQKITGQVAKTTVSKTTSSKAVKAAAPVAPARLVGQVKGMSRAKAKVLGASLGLLSLAVAGGFILLSAGAQDPHSALKGGVAGRVNPAATAIAAKNGPRGGATIKSKSSSAHSSALALHAPGSSKAASDAAQLGATGDEAVSDFGGTTGRAGGKHGTNANGQDSKDANGSKLAKGERRPATAEEISKIRSMLLSPDPKDRLAALRLARTLDAPELAADVRALLGNEKNVPVKRVGVQVLALDDPSTSQDTFKQMRNDPDAVVRVNSAFGMARGGDPAQAAWLLKVYDASRVVAPRLVPVLGAALEDPTIQSPAVVARFQQIANNPKLSPDLRARAAAVVTAKTGH